VWVFYGSGAGLHAAGEQVFDQDSFPGDHGGTETGDQFGYALAAGDLDADGFDDLAIGTPFENSPEPLGTCGFDLSCDDHGAFHVVFGSAAGLDFDRTYSTGSSFSQGDGKGFALAVGDFDGNPSAGAELAVASPGSFDSSLGGADHTGRVALYRFDPVSVMAPLGSFSSDPEEVDAQWGWALGGGKLGTGGSRAIAVGAHLSDVAGSNQAGRATVVDPEEIEPHGDLVQTDFGMAGNGGDDHFGAALAVGDFDGDGFDDLAIAAPEKNDGGVADSGRVYVAFGSASGPDTSQFEILSIADFAGSTPATGDAFGTALAAGDYDGDGFDDLFFGAPGRGSDDRGFVYFVHGTAAGLA
ncbi:MAG: integrin alpha, partial [Thermoanaerobaculia bacterium]|nr:integrin alpha [Thermoanaerobaculia bacterium]